MSSPVAARRLELLTAARPDLQGWLRFEPGKLRFSLGTSLADLAIPVELAADARAIVRAAAVEVALLLATQHKRLVPADELDRLLLREESGGLPSVLPTLGPGAGGADLRAAALLGTQCHPALTGGLLTAWLARGGKGRSLVGLWIELLRRAFEEMPGARGEETPLVVALALSAEVAAAEAEVRAFLPVTTAERWLRGGAMTALWVAGRTGVLRAFRDAGRAEPDPLLDKVEAACSPLLLLGGRTAVLASGTTAYGCELSAGVPRADELTTRALAGGDPAALATELLGALSADDALAVRAEQAAAVARLRDLLFQAAAGAEAAGQEVRVAPLRDLLGSPGTLSAGAADVAPRQLLLRQLEKLGLAGDAALPLERAMRALRDWRPREPGASFGVPREQARLEYAQAAAGLCADLALERLAGPARRALSFRTGKEAEGGAESEWEAGRLYRLSARPGPILKEAVERPVAHLFADVKDFTRRTTLLGQASMAEFLRREFYLPILAAAKEHYSGMRHLADRGGVQLNNLLGDAISFSGRIEAMVVLAQAIRRAFEAYAVRLGRELHAEGVQHQLEALSQAHQAGIDAAARARAAAEAEAAAAPPGSPAQASARALARRAALEEARAVEERAKALARAQGEGLEAGVFISHGPAPLVVAIEDEVFGANRVAIADKINESARGTARAAAARLRADAQLRAATTPHRPSLKHAWSVFIGQPLAFQAPPAVEAEALALARSGDLPRAMRALAGTVREGLEGAAREPADRPGDIYNMGVALSEEALAAFLDEVGAKRVVRRVELQPEQVPPQVAAFFWFGAEPQSLVLCFHPDGRLGEMFRRVGKAAFKGLGGVTVWELCAEGAGPAALAATLGPGWFRGASGEV